MAKNYTENVQWNSSNKSDYSTSTIYSYLNDSWLNKVDASVAKIIKQVKIPYCKWDGTSLSTLTGGNGLSSKVFLLSGREIGWTANVSSYIPDDGVKLQYFDSDMTTSAVSKHSDMIQRWLRSPHKGYMTMALYVKSNGDWGAPYCTDHNATNPTFIVPSNTFIDDNHNIVV